MRTIVSRFTSCVIAAAVLIASTPNVSAQEEEATQYFVQTILCSVQPGLTFGELDNGEYTRSEYRERKSERERKQERGRIEKALKNKINYGTGDVHIRDFLHSVSDAYKLNLVVDSRVVPLKGGNLRVVSDADLMQGNPGATEYVTDAIIHNLDIHELTIENALKLVLKQVNLDYRIEDGFIWITSPQKLRDESFSDFLAEVNQDRILLWMEGTLRLLDSRSIRLGETENLVQDVKKLDQYKDFAVLARPNIATLAGQPVSINISTEVPYEHLVPLEAENDDVAFVSETKYEEVGTIIGMTVHKNSVGGLLFDCNAEVSILDGREPVSGTDLPVGKPKIIRVKREIAGAEVEPNKWFAMLMNTPSDDILLMLTRIQVKAKEEQTAEAQPEIAITTRWHQALGRVEDDEGHSEGDAIECKVIGGEVHVFALPEGSDSIDEIPRFQIVESMGLHKSNTPLILHRGRKRQSEQDSPQTLFKLVVFDQKNSGEIDELDLNERIGRLTPPNMEPLITAEEVQGYTFSITNEHSSIPYRYRWQSNPKSHETKSVVADTGTMLAVTEMGDEEAASYTFDIRLEFRRPKLVLPRTSFETKEEAESALLYGRAHFELDADPAQNYAFVLPLREHEYAVCTFRAEPYHRPPAGPKRRGGVGGQGGGGGAAKPANH